MSATADLKTVARPTSASQLRHGALSLPETIGQSIANIAPTLTPALNISVVAGIAGVGSWLSYLIATVGCVFVGGCIATLARRHPEAGSYFVYIGRNFGPVTGALAGWLMILAYLACGIAVVSGFPLFLTAFFGAFGMTLAMPWLVVCSLAFIGLVCYASYRDIKLSSRVGLVLEVISISIIILITAFVVAKKGTVIDPVQLNIGKLPVAGIMSAMAFAVFSFVGFESSATLAKESNNPHRNIPLAVMGSAAAAGLFFTIIAYFMVLGMNDKADVIGNSGSPFADMTNAAHLPWAAGVVYFAAMISAFACCLACMNAGSRMLYSMGRYQFLHSSMGLVHSTHKTPYAAVLASAAVVCVGFLALAPQGFLNEFNETGTICTYGFVVVYLGVALTASLDIYRAGLLKPWHIACTVIGAALMLFVIYSSVFPWPAAPDQYLPEIFIAYIVIGLVWFLILKQKSPAVLASIAGDMEG
jgi:amino acid transporter